MKRYNPYKTPRSATVGKLALILLALPVSGAYAVAYDHSTTLDTAAHLSSSTALPSTMAATGLTAAGTATDLNTNYIGWSVTPNASVSVYWSTSGLQFDDASQTDLVVGAAQTTSSTASSSYNTLDIADYLSLGADSLMIGQGALGTGADVTKVDTTKPADYNAVSIAGAVYDVASSGFAATKLNTVGDVTVGMYGNGNTFNVSSGAVVTSVNLYIGKSDSDNPAYGCNNALNISGVVPVSVLGGSLSAHSTVGTSGITVIGEYGSGNSLNIADGGALDSASSIRVGLYGSTNIFTATDSSINTTGNIEIGYKPSATYNEVTWTNTTVSSVASPVHTAFVGKFGSNNILTISKSEINGGNLYVGFGDNEAEKDNSEDGTEGYIATEGSNNALTATDSTFTVNNTFTVGRYGSNNTATITGGYIFSRWTDVKQDDADAPDNVIQLNELVGVRSIGVGVGADDAEHDYSALGCNNILTIEGATFSVLDLISVGYSGSGNYLEITDGAQGVIQGNTAKLTIGTGDPDNNNYGSYNSVSIAGAGTKLTLSSEHSLLSVGTFGRDNTMTILDGAEVTVNGGISVGTGVIPEADKDNSDFGSHNTLAVMNNGTKLSAGNGDAFYIGKYGSENWLIVAYDADVNIDASATYLGYNGTKLGDAFNPDFASADNNILYVANNAKFTSTGDLYVGYLGCDNVLVSGMEGSVVDISKGNVCIGYGSEESPVLGSNNVVYVTNDGILMASGISIGGDSGNMSSDNLLRVEAGGIVVVGKEFSINTKNGEGNCLRLNEGMVAFKGKRDANDILWTDYIVNGYISDKVSGTVNAGLVDQGAIQIWDYVKGDYVTATKSDLSVKYCSSEAEAEAATGYAGLSGYTIVKPANELSRLTSWAGELYASGDGNYCSSWYGWFYNDTTYGNWIMSYNDYAWQYVAPNSTEDDMYLYDSSLGAWLYTNSTYFQNKWVYNYGTSAWQQLGE